MVYVASTINSDKNSSYIGIFKTMNEVDQFANEQNPIMVACSEHLNMKLAKKFMKDLVKMTPWYKDWNNS